jgi:glycosyltransferase involved in cell wall biosynthesis
METTLDETTGTGRYVCELCSGLAKKGVEVVVLSALAENEQAADCFMKTGSEKVVRHVHLLRERPFHKLSRRTKEAVFSQIVREVLGTEPFDVVHVMYGHYSWPLAARIAASARIMTVHNVPPREYEMPFLEERTSLETALNNIYRLAVSMKHCRLLRSQSWDGIIANSPKTKMLVDDIMIGSKVTTRAIGMGPSVEWGGCSRRRPEAQGEWRLVTIAAGKQHKQLHLIPAISEYLAKAGIIHSWDIAGPTRSPRYQAIVARELARYGTGSRVRFLGEVGQDRLLELLDSAHLYVQPSLEEGFCITVLDALARKLPVVATRTGAITEMLQEGGGIDTNFDAEAIARGIMDLVGDYDAYAGEELHWKTYADMFSWDRVVEATMNFYETILSQNNGGRLSSDS